MRDLKAALVARALAQRVRVSVLVRAAVARDFGVADGDEVRQATPSNTPPLQASQLPAHQPTGEATVSNPSIDGVLIQWGDRLFYLSNRSVKSKLSAIAANPTFTLLC